MFTIDDIDIFITTHNRANFLEESIKSLLEQTIKPLCITVLDNESTDNTEEIVKRFANQGVQYIKTYGFLGNFNKAKDTATKTYCMLFHDDDLLHPKYFEYALEVLNKYEDVSLVTTRYTEFFDNSPPTYCNDLSSRHYLLQDKNFPRMMYFCEIIAYAPAIYRTKDFLSTPLEYDRYSKFNDWPFMVNISQKGNTILFDDVRVFLVRRHSGQDTLTNTNVPTLEQIVNWDVLFYESIKPKFFTKEWFCFMKKAKTFRKGKYRAFIPNEYKKSSDKRLLTKYAKSNNVYHPISVMVNFLLPKQLNKAIRNYNNKLMKENLINT